MSIFSSSSRPPVQERVSSPPPTRQRNFPMAHSTSPRNHLASLWMTCRNSSDSLLSRMRIFSRSRGSFHSIAIRLRKPAALQLIARRKSACSLCSMLNSRRRSRVLLYLLLSVSVSASVMVIKFYFIVTEYCFFDQLLRSCFNAIYLPV